MRLRFLAIGAAAAAIAAAAMLLRSGGTSAAADQALAACMQGDSSRTVLSSFTMTQGSEYQKHLPHMGLTPEIDNAQPAYVTVFSGPVKLAAMVPAPPADGATPGVTSDLFTGVVCIVQGQVPNFYVNVDTTGMTP